MSNIIQFPVKKTIEDISPYDYKFDDQCEQMIRIKQKLDKINKMWESIRKRPDYKVE